MKLSKLSFSNSSKFLKNRILLNVVFILAFINVMALLLNGRWNTLLLFIVIGFMVQIFTKNMTVILGIPLLTVNLLNLGGKIKEGLANNGENINKTDIEKKNAAERAQSNHGNGDGNVMKKANLYNQKESLTNFRPEQKTSQGLQMGQLENASDENNAAQSNGGAGTNKSKGVKKNYEIDYATTVEEAYDNLNNILGSDGIQRLTADSQKLMQQQVQLAEAMKNMTPLIQSIEPMVQNLQGMMGQMDGKEGLSGIMNLAKQFMPPSQAANTK